MSVSVETLSGLERKVTISIPSDKIEKEVRSRLKHLESKVKVDGFRPGKVPPHIVQQRFSDSVREEVTRDLIPNFLSEALEKEQLTPAGMPAIEPERVQLGKDFTFSALFEVFPKVEPVELNQAEVDVIESVVTDKDVEQLIEKLRGENKVWSDVTRVVKEGDKVFADFEGFVNDEPFEGGRAENYEMIVGAGKMIPGFEEGVIGAELDKQFDLKIAFPEDYGHADLAGKDAVFKVTVRAVQEGVLPDVDEAFAEKFNIKEGGVEALKRDLRSNMERELERRVSSTNREHIFSKMLEKNPFDVPSTLVNREIENLKHDMYHRLFGHEHHDNEKIPDFPRELFVDQATRRVHLGLLFSAYVEKHQLEVEDARVDAMIEKMATAYEEPEEIRAWYKGNAERRGEIQALVMEELVAEKMMEDARVIKKAMDYDAVMNPKKDEN